MTRKFWQYNIITENVFDAYGDSFKEALKTMQYIKYESLYTMGIYSLDGWYTYNHLFQNK